VKTRIITLIVLLLLVSLGMALSLAPASPAPVVRAAAGLAAPWQSTAALTYTAYLPVVFQCYPRLGPDPDFSSQYDMNLINADAAWGLCNLTASGVTIAIIDTGVDLDHPDLQANLLPGYDYWDYDTVPEDGNGHGTNVAGIAAAALNGIHVAGVAPTAKILPVRVLNNNGSGYLSDVAAGITYAADRAQVLNLSLGGTTNSSTMQNAINYAANTRGRLVIAAAGNCGDSNFSANGCTSMNQIVYPAAYSNVMAVASTTSSDTRSSFSNVGSYVDIAAPGSNIYNTYYGNSYYSESGTSQASPHVAGLAALVWAQNSGYSAAQVWNRITATAVDLGAVGVDTSFGAGRIDVQQALGLTTLRMSAAHLPEAQPIAVVDQRTAPIAPGRIIVGFKETIGRQTQSQLAKTWSNAVVANSIPAIDALVLNVPAGSEWEMIDQLRTRPEVKYAEPDYLLKLIP
jgi:thermitase